MNCGVRKHKQRRERRDKYFLTPGKCYYEFFLSFSIMTILSFMTFLPDQLSSPETMYLYISCMTYATFIIDIMDKSVNCSFFLLEKYFWVAYTSLAADSNVLTKLV